MADDDPVATQARQLQASVETLMRTDKLDECLLALCEGQTLRLLRTMAPGSGHHPEETIRTISPLLQALITAATTRDLPLSDETEMLIRTFKNVGVTFTEVRSRRPSRPLSAAPHEPLGFSVFVDESGTASFTEKTQPVLCMVGIVVRDDTIQPFERAADGLLSEYGLTPETEVHAGEWLSRRENDPVPTLNHTQRDELLQRFLTLGMQHAKGLHYLSMAKELVKPEYREKIRRQGLDAYTHTVLWFAVTLDRALLPLTMPAGYKYFYDQHSSKDIARIFGALTKEDQNKGLKLMGLKATPVSLDSKHSRLIQLADVTAYYLNRYRDFEVRALTPRRGLEKHEERVRETFALMQPKVLDYIRNEVYRLIDWKALADFSL